jgi:hypothetical protein
MATRQRQKGDVVKMFFFPEKQKICDKIFHFPIAFVQNSHKRMMGTKIFGKINIRTRG